MKITYLFTLNIDRESGVLNKINSQIEEWISNGHQVQCIIINNEKAKFNRHSLTSAVTRYKVFQNKIAEKLPGSFFKYFNRILSNNEIENEMASFTPDVIYFREMIGYPGLKKLLDRRPVVMEINTIMQTELKRFSYFHRLIYNYYKRKIYRRVNGAVCVTHEIESAVNQDFKRTKVIANGFDFNKINSSDIEFNFNTKDSVIFVATPGMDWHGVDRYYELAKALPDIEFHLIGPTHDNEDKLPNFFVHGFLNRAQLKDFYNKATVGLGTLAFERAGLKEGCSLKIREYLAWGIPVVLASRDTDLSNDSHPFVLQIDFQRQSFESIIDSLKAFVTQWSKKRVAKNEVEDLLSVQSKEKIRLNFMSEIQNTILK